MYVRKPNVRRKCKLYEKVFMHKIIELPAWERLFKRIVWEQIGKIEKKEILDFGSGEGIANHFAKGNAVVAIEPSEEMINNRWADYDYKQIVGDASVLSEFLDNSFDMIICHNVLEYIDDKIQVINELHRLLKVGGTLSIVKHNRAGRVMQTAVLLDDIEQANNLLDGKESTSSKFGSIRYYKDEEISKWNNGLKLLNTYGIRTFWDLQQNQEKHKTEEWQSKMMRLEMRVSTMNEYKKIAFFHHLLLTKE